MTGVKHQADRLAFSAPNPRTFYDPKRGSLSQIRRHHTLPLAWTHLSAGDIAEIRSCLALAIQQPLTKLEREACLAIECILTTGRSLTTLRKLKYFPTLEDFQRSQLSEQSFGLVAEPDGLKWHLPAGDANRARTSKTKPRLGNKRRRIASVEFLASELTLEIFAQHWRKPHMRGNIFSSNFEKLSKQIGAMLERRRSKEFAMPRKMACRLVALERYRFNELIHEAGGDDAHALRSTDAVNHRIAPSAAYHLPGDRLRAADPSDEDSVVSSTTNVLKRFITALWNDVERTRRNPAEHHRAFLAYSVELITFCTGSRGNFSSFPSAESADRMTGFLQLNDKDSENPSRARLIWLPPVVVNQLAYYEEYLLDFYDFSGGPPTRFSSHIYPELVFPRYFDPHTELSIRDVLETSRTRHACSLPTNIGRHWLRTHMLNRCSTETLHAFMGHWSKGMEPWSYGSFFDPLTYRADLVRTVQPLLKELGWKPVRGTLPL